MTAVASSACHCPARLPLKSGSVPRGGLEALGPHILSAAPLMATLPLNLALCSLSATLEQAGQTPQRSSQEITEVSGRARDRATTVEVALACPRVLAGSQPGL